MKKSKIPIVQCLECGGSGSIPSAATGKVLRREREARGIPRVSRDPTHGIAHHFGYSESYTLELERDSKPWTWLLIRKYRDAIERAAKARDGGQR